MIVFNKLCYGLLYGYVEAPNFVRQFKPWIKVLGPNGFSSSGIVICVHILDYRQRRKQIEIKIETLLKFTILKLGLLPRAYVASSATVLCVLYFGNRRRAIQEFDASTVRIDQ